MAPMFLAAANVSADLLDLARWGPPGLVLALLIAGQFRLKREIERSDAETSAWKHAYEVQRERAEAAEAAARHIIESGDISAALVEALTSVAGTLGRDRQ